MSRIPYAGFDPEEENFDGIELAALHEQDIAARAQNTGIDIERARYLRWLGLSWAAVGRQIAKECGRRVAYKGLSIRYAVLTVAPASYIDGTPSLCERPGPKPRAALERL